MPEVKRGPYTFIGGKAESSAHYYDIVMSRNRYIYKRDMDALAWDAAHKFGSRVSFLDTVSFDHGWIYGARAEEAAEYYETEWYKAFNACPEEWRSNAMRRVANSLIPETEYKYHVRFEILSWRYYGVPDDEKERKVKEERENRIQRKKNQTEYRKNHAAERADICAQISKLPLEDQLRYICEPGRYAPGYYGINFSTIGDDDLKALPTDLLTSIINTYPTVKDKAWKDLRKRAKQMMQPRMKTD